MSIYRVQSRLPYFTGIPEDVTTTTSWWEGADIDVPRERTEIANRLRAAWGVIDSRLSRLITRDANGCRLVMYDMADPVPRMPVEDYGFTIPTGGTDIALPSEVALVLSYHATFVSGEPNARRRGRMYLGPFSYNGDANRPDAALLLLVQEYGEKLWTAIDAGASVTWSQHSDTTTFTLPVTGGWVDNSWDTQRRRGVGATSRQFLGAPPA